jgi:hypothetical protein
MTPDPRNEPLRERIVRELADAARGHRLVGALGGRRLDWGTCVRELCAARPTMAVERGKA